MGECSSSESDIELAAATDASGQFSEAVIDSVDMDKWGLELREKLDNLMESEQDHPALTKHIVQFLCSAFLADDGSLVKESLALDK